MALVTSSGVGSGNDFESIISATVSARKSTLTSKTDTKKALLESEQSGLTQLKSALKTFKSACDNLVANSTSDPFNVHKINTTQSSNYSAFSITAKSDCTNTSFDIAVNQLAKAENISRTFSTAEGFSNSFSAGTLTISLGSEEVTNSSGETETQEKSFTVNIAEGDTLEMIRKRINSNDYGVNCNLVQTDSGYALSISSGTTGKDTTELKISVNSEDTDGHDSLSLLAFNPESDVETDEDGNKVAAESSSWRYNQGKDAIIDVDGNLISSHTNEFKSQVAGVEITVNQVSETETVDGVSGLKSYSVDITSDLDSIASKMNAFVSAYNTVLDTMAGLYKRDTYTDGQSNYDGGNLAGDSQVKSIMNTLQSMVVKFEPHENGKSIFDLGLEYTKDGRLSLDSTKFKEAVQNNYGSVSNLLTGSNGLTKQLSDYTKEYTQLQGVMDKRLDDVSSQIDYWTEKANRNEEILEAYEQNLRTKYGNLDALMAGYSSSMSYLSSVLSSVNASSGSSS